MVLKALLEIYFCLILTQISVLPTKGNRVLELNDKLLEVLQKESEVRSFLVLFYAPWCHHCHQLEPVWTQVAQQLHNKADNVLVSRIDCTKYTAVASHFSIRGYPTILFISKDKRFEYRGERALNDILEFAVRVSGPSIRTINDCTEIGSLRQKHDVFFADFGQNINENFSTIADKYQSIDWFYYSSLNCNPFANGIYAIKANKYHKKFEENDSELEKWIKIERFPQFVKISNGNFNLLLQTRKYLVIALIEEFKSMGKLNPNHKSFYDRIESIAYSYHNTKDVIFGWTSEITTINSIAIRSISPLPNIITINSTTLQYYLIEDQLNDQNIIAFLDDLTQNSSKLTASGGDRFWHRIHRLGFDTITSLVGMYYGNPLLTILLFGLPMSFLSIIIYTTCCSDILDAKDEEVDEDDNEEEESTEHQKRD